MTKKDIFIQILSEVSGKPKNHLEAFTDQLEHVFGPGNWEEELPEKDAQELLVKLRSEGPAIMVWLANKSQVFKALVSDENGATH